MENFTPVSAVAGGALIGLSTAVLWVANGRIAGISGIVGGMLAPLSARPAKVLAFLDVAGPAWDPTLAFVLISAVVVTALDGRRLFGAALFGVGWGLVGYCPGPALAALALGAPAALAFVLAMLTGMGLFTVFDRGIPTRAGA